MSSAAKDCKLREHGWRRRSTGPEHPLRILRCHDHEIFFALYPPGFTPYSRRLLAPVDESGDLLPVEDEREPSVQRWRGTLLDAALDAAAGERWVRDDEPGPCSKPLYATQVRWLVRLERLFGLVREQSASVVEAIRQALGLSLTEHASARRQATATRRLMARGQALVVLGALLAGDDALWSRLVSAGHVAQLWSEPWLWEPRIGQFQFPSRTTTATRRARGP